MNVNIETDKCMQLVTIYGTSMLGALATAAPISSNIHVDESPRQLSQMA